MSEYPDPPNCPRCAVPGHVDWINVQTMGDTESVWIPGSQWCVTPGCVDEQGKRTLFVPSPAVLRANEERAWFDLQRRLIEE